ncbi:MAG: hypothetical protein P1P74_05285 [Desulfuromonadales bacterium]|nr:hypothetical protein [Desulfuromonadales bacterium]
MIGTQSGHAAQPLVDHAALFSRLQDEELQRLASRSEIVAGRKNTTLYSAHEQSDCIYLVKQGRPDTPLRGLRLHPGG